MRAVLQRYHHTQSHTYPACTHTDTLTHAHARAHAHTHRLGYGLLGAALAYNCLVLLELCALVACMAVLHVGQHGDRK